MSLDLTLTHRDVLMLLDALQVARREREREPWSPARLRDQDVLERVESLLERADAQGLGVTLRAS